MSRDESRPPLTLEAVLRLFRSLPPRVQLTVVGVGLVLVAVAALLLFVWVRETARPGREAPAGAGAAGDYLLCTWNLENYFDDEDDPANHDDVENWFGRDPEAFREKTEHLAEALLLMNEGRGPDILAACEVESGRALGALRDALNARLGQAGNGALPYEHVLFEPDATGRHFAPGILTRLPVARNRTRQLKAASRMQRILEGHVVVNGYDLTVIAAHWTSRLRGEEGTAEHRMLYAQKCYGEARAILTANPDADVVVCGDFNDTFDDPSVRDGLHASDDPEAVRRSAGQPLILDLCAHLDQRLDPKGTIYHERRWQIFDHICVSRGLLDDRGWSCDPNRTEIFGPRELRTGADRRPFAFGRQKHRGERGYSDHLPVLTHFRVAGGD